MTELSTQDLISSTRDLLNATRTSAIKIGENLYNIKSTLPEGTVWADLLRDELDLSEGQASKLMSIYRVFVLEGGLSHAQLEGIDTERLYMAKSLEGSPEEKLAKASTLSRKELRQENIDDKFGDSHQHVLGKTRWAKCVECDSFVVCQET